MLSKRDTPPTDAWNPAVSQIDQSPIQVVEEEALDSSATINFLDRLHPNQDRTLTSFEPHPSAVTLPHTSTDRLNTWVRDKDHQSDVYVLIGQTKVTNKKPKKDEMTGSRWLWVDIDPRKGKLLKEERRRILNLLTDGLPKELPPPTIIVDSGRGYWALWELAETVTDVALIERLNFGLAGTVGGDSCHNIDRVMRLVGTVNKKTGRVAALVRDNRRKYEPKDFAELKLAEEKKKSEPPTVDIGEAVRVDDLAELDEWNVPDRVKVIIAKGRDPDRPKQDDDSRSAWVFDACCQLIRCGVPPEVILGILASPAWGISESVFEQCGGKAVTNPERYARRQIERAIAAVVRDTPAACDDDFEVNKDPEPKSAPESRERPCLVSLAPVDRDALPERPWLAEGLLMRGMVSLVAARGGAGKSLFSLQLGIMCAMGMDWAYWSARYKTRVLVLNAEDDLDEQRRRLLSATEVMDTAQEELADRLLVLDVPRFELFERPPDSDDGAIQKTPLYNELVKLIRDEKIGLLIVDPLIETHAGLDENSNTDMKEVILGLRDLARIAECCVMVVHHSRKGQVAGDQDSARGGSALVNACRVAVTLDPMSESEAQLLPPAEVDERWRYVKLCGAKANYTGRGAERWLRLESVRLRNNGSPEGDSSPGMVAVDLHGKGVLTDEQRMRVLNEVNMAATSKSWLRASKSGTEGRLDLRMKEILNIGKEVAGQFMKQLLKDGWIAEEEVTGQDRHKRKVLVVARWPDEDTQREEDLPF